jgi:hypothetical protein
MILCIVGLIYDKYNKHKGEITAIDYDGKNLCSGGADGTINIYKITFRHVHMNHMMMLSMMICCDRHHYLD